MTTNRDPEEIRADIARTRAAVSNDVEDLAQSARPANVARRQVDKVKDAVGGVKDRVMGSDDDQGPSVGDRLADRADEAREAVAEAPRAVKAKAQGNPLAAGLIAFGAGLLVSSLIPSSQAEQRAVSNLEEKVAPLKEKAAEAGQDALQHLKQPAQEAVESVKETAAAGVENVKEESAGAVQDVKAQAVDSKETLQQQ